MKQFLFHECCTEFIRKMAARLFVLFTAFAVLQVQGQAQDPIPSFPVNGIHDQRPSIYVFTNAHIVLSPEQSIPNGAMLISNGRIVAIGPSVTIPPGAKIIDLRGKWIFPSFIDLDSDYGLPKRATQRRQWNDKPQPFSSKKQAFGWNDALHPEWRAVDSFIPQEKIAEQYARKGFAAVLTFFHDGICRGTGALVATKPGKANTVILRADASAHFSFDKGSSQQDYPTSLMGAIALLRQTYYDAQWYKNGGYKQAYNITLEKWDQLRTLPNIFEVSDKLDILRADKIGDEFGIQYIIRTSGNEYQLRDEVKKTHAPLIVPLSFPRPYDLTDPFVAEKISITDLLHWEHAPRNPALLEQSGIEFALTSAGCNNPKVFWENLRKAIRYGLSQKTALAALTTIPAQLLNVYDQLGTLHPGKIANFFITDGNVFEQETTIYEHWILGTPFRFYALEISEFFGDFTLTIGDLPPLQFRISGTPENPHCTVGFDTTEMKRGRIAIEDRMIHFHFQLDSVYFGTIRCSGWLQDSILSGKALLPDGRWVEWKAFRVRYTGPRYHRDTIAIDTTAISALPLPFAPYGWLSSLPEKKTYLIKNATIWTNEPQGILPETDLLIQNGKIAAIGKNLTGPQEAIIIDATGKHITPGIIDEHSHIAITGGVNEASEAITSEVRISDVINPEDVNIYRALAGGVTTVHLLHGSANPIGGQTAIIKLRWGYPPDSLLFRAAPPFIKFALGENVKQSNWGDNYTIRYPQTRMGVEQLFRDAFQRALQYKQEWMNWHRSKRKNETPPRRDLELDALVEILEGKRFITCHSYVQSEILALMRVAEDFGFRVNTFTHVLEGYKVATELLQHGAAASSFSDWWAYKYEVIEAIPYNGALLHRVGVLTGFNSDSPEMGRRLNQEAAKAIKYGNLSEEEALKFVTLHPAQMLHIADRVGSIKVGKDADIVLWNTHPLSSYAQAEKTFVDGILFFDREVYQTLSAWIKAQKERLIQKMQQERAKGAVVQKPEIRQQKIYNCMDREP